MKLLYDKKLNCSRCLIFMFVMFFLILFSVQKVEAISQTQVESKLSDLRKQYVGTTWNDYYYGTQCKGFANLIFYKLFGIAHIGAYDNNSKYYIPSPQGAKELGKLSPSAMTQTSAKNLLNQGAPGDFIQVKRRNKTYGHSMILVSKDSNGISVFDCNSDGKNGVKLYYITWNSFYNSNSAMSLYRANNYSDISGGNFNNPTGTIDCVEDATNAVWVRGWAYDADDTSKSLQIHVYIGGPAGIGEGHVITANTYRNDVNNAYGSGDYHGYDATIPTSLLGNQTVYIYAINIKEGENVLLGTKDVMITDDTTAPLITDVHIFQYSNTSYTVKCTVSDKSEITSVKFPSWNTSDAGSSAVWYEGTISNNIATCTIPIDKSGTYRTDIYAYDAKSNLGFSNIGIDAYADNPLTYEYENNYYVVIDCEETMAGCVIVPSFVCGKKVYRIARDAFKDCHGLESVILPESSFRIGGECFKDCINLKSVVIPSSFTDIGVDIFKNCYGLTDIYYLGNDEQWNNIKLDDDKWGYPDTVTVHYNYSDVYTIPETNVELSLKFESSLGFYIADCNEDARGYITIPSNINGIPIHRIAIKAFQNCSSLEAINIPNTVKRIGQYGFQNCSNIKRISIPKSMESFGVTIFDGCSNLTDIFYEGIQSDWDNIIIDGGRIGTDAKVHYSGYIVPGTNAMLTIVPEEGEYVILECNEEASGNIIIPEYIYGIPVRRIARDAFLNCSQIETITMLSGYRLGGLCFSECSSLKSIFLPESLTQIGENVFNRCINLTNIYYAGKKENWESIENSSYVDNLGITMHFNYEEHQHNYITVNTEPTCTLDGYTTYSCMDCGDTYIDNIIKSLGHTLLIENGIQSTCTTDGLTEGIRCTACNDVIIQQQSIPKTGHEFSDWDVVIESSCTNNGMLRRICNRCGKSEEQEKYRQDHKYDEWFYDTVPTCEDKGSKKKICLVCGKVESEFIEAKGHKWKKEYEEDVAATCTDAGIESIHCELCGMSNESTQKTLSKTDHQYGQLSIIKLPTCIDNGEKVRICFRCGLKQRERIAKEEHKYNIKIIAPTCKESGYTLHECVNCKSTYKDTYTNMTGHIGEEWIITKQSTKYLEGERIKKCLRCAEIINRQSIPRVQEDNRIEQVKLNKTKIIIAVKNTSQLKVIEKQSGDKVIKYYSTNNKVASVSKNGKITAKKVGMCDIVVTMKSGQIAKCKITVTTVKTPKIKFFKKSLILKKGRAIILKIKRTSIVANDSLAWRSSRPKIVKAYKNGKIKGLKRGKSIITVKARSGYIAKIKVIVK